MTAPPSVAEARLSLSAYRFQGSGQRRRVHEAEVSWGPGSGGSGRASCSESAGGSVAGAKGPLAARHGKGHAAALPSPVSREMPQDQLPIRKGTSPTHGRSHAARREGRVGRLPLLPPAAAGTELPAPGGRRLPV